jgi:hypothetical protein
MRQKSKSTPVSSEGVVRDIRGATRKHQAAEEKIRIVLDGLRGETSIAELCRPEGIAESISSSGAKRRTPRKLSPSRPSNCDCSKKHARGWGTANEIPFIREA